MVFRRLELEPDRIELRLVGRVTVALARLIGGNNFVDGAELDRVKTISRSRKKSATLASVVVPSRKQMAAWLMVNTEFTPSALLTRKPCPSM